MSKKPGATSATYDVGGKPKGTRTSKNQPRGKLGSDDFNESLDSEKRHGEQLLGGRVYSDHPEIVAEIQRHSDQIIDHHARDPQMVTFKRADVLANQHGFESQPDGVELKGAGERSPKVKTFSRQSKRGGRSA